jgi:hypothetical protein
MMPWQYVRESTFAAKQEHDLFQNEIFANTSEERLLPLSVVVV